MKRVTHWHVFKYPERYACVAILIIAACLLLLNCDRHRRVVDPEPPAAYQLQVSLSDTSAVFDPAQVINFNIRLTRQNNPAVGEIVGVIDPMNNICGETPSTDSLGNTHYVATANTPGLYSFGFWTPDGQEFANCNLVVNETNLDNSFHYIYNPNPPTIALGPNRTETKESIAQKMQDVGSQAVVDQMTNPAFLLSGLVCVGGVVVVLGSDGGGSPFVAEPMMIACPVAMENLLDIREAVYNLTYRSVSEFVTDPTARQNALNYLTGINLALAVVTIDASIINSPVRGLAFPKLNMESHMGAGRGRDILRGVTDVAGAVFDAQNAIATLMFPNDSAMVLTVCITQNSPTNNYSQYEVVTVGIGKMMSGDHAIEVSGLWNGILTQPSGHGPVVDYNYHLDLTQTETIISGYSRTEIPNTHYFVAKRVSGHTDGNQVFLHDVAIDSQRTPIFTYWLMHTDTLSLNQWSDSLNGTWMSPQHESGAIHVARQQ